MSGNDDGHGPKTCTYTKCNAQVFTPCPFVKDKVSDKDINKASTRQLADKLQCKHEWRQLRVPDGYLGFKFYCSRCLAIREHDYGDMA